MSEATITPAEAAELYNYGVGKAGITAGAWTLLVDVEDSPVNRVSRWHEKRWLVLRNGAAEIYGVEYGVGLTEDQEDSLPWEPPFGSKTGPIELVRLVARVVTRTEYDRA